MDAIGTEKTEEHRLREEFLRVHKPDANKTRVTLHGLKGRADLNGAYGEVDATEVNSRDKEMPERIPVAVLRPDLKGAEKKKILVRPRNMLVSTRPKRPSF